VFDENVFVCFFYIIIAMYSSSDKIENVTDKIQTRIVEIQNWAQKWKMFLNPSNSTTVFIILRKP